MLHRRAFNHDTLIANSCGVSFWLRQGLLENGWDNPYCLVYVLIENMYVLPNTQTFFKKTVV